MLPHCESQIRSLAERAQISSTSDSNGWSVDIWRMDEGDVDAALEAYEALLLGGLPGPIERLLAEKHSQYAYLLAGGGRVNNKITRADISELTAAASLVASESCSTNDMFMPNVPKASRVSSEPGFDITLVELEKHVDERPLGPDERLVVASVKHSINRLSSQDVKSKLVQSVSDESIDDFYIMTQLRKLCGQLVIQGYLEKEATRVFLFHPTDMPYRAIRFVAVAVVDPDLEVDLLSRMAGLPNRTEPTHAFRIVLMPGLRTVHEATF